jgi:beta-xylosidase
VRPVRKRTGRALGLALTLLLAAPLTAAEPQPQMTGDVQIHDPSVIEIGGQFVAVGTGQQGPTHGAIRAKTSPDGVRWTDAGLIGEGPPAWARVTLGFKPLNVWAPSISRRGSTVSLYYCLSSFGHNTSAIGLMTNTSFDPLKPGEGWQDQGLVLMSKEGDDFNAIDPFRIDTSDGRAYLAFGSFWSGVKLSELNPETGKLIRADAPRIRWPAATAARSRPRPSSSATASSPSSSASINAARASPRPTTYASGAPTRSRGHTETKTARRCWRAEAPCCWRRRAALSGLAGRRR